jgi:hypothetical protein
VLRKPCVGRLSFQDCSHTLTWECAEAARTLTMGVSNLTEMKC